MLARLGKGTSRLSILNAVVWVLLFFVFRIVLGTYSSVALAVDVFRVWRTPFTPEGLKPIDYDALLALRGQGFDPAPPNWAVAAGRVASPAVLSVLNYFWFYKIVTTMARKLSKGKQETKANR